MEGRENNFSDGQMPADRRQSDRMATVLRTVLIEAEGFSGFCLMRNLSENGMMGEIFTRLPTDRPITVIFGDDAVVLGVVRWCEKGRVGIYFAEPIDLDAMLRSRDPLVEGWVRRPPRLQLKCRAHLTFGSLRSEACVLDISQGGMRIAPSFLLLQAEDELDIHLPGFVKRRAMVRWKRGRFCGLNFIQSLPLPQLAKWAAHLQDERAAGAARVAG